MTALRILMTPWIHMPRISLVHRRLIVRFIRRSMLTMICLLVLLRTMIWLLLLLLTVIWLLLLLLTMVWLLLLTLIPETRHRRSRPRSRSTLIVRWWNISRGVSRR
jgi:hypothetical protein